MYISISNHFGNDWQGALTFRDTQLSFTHTDFAHILNYSDNINL